MNRKGIGGAKSKAALAERDRYLKNIEAMQAACQKHGWPFLAEMIALTDQWLVQYGKVELPGDEP